MYIKKLVKKLEELEPDSHIHLVDSRELHFDPKIVCTGRRQYILVAEDD